VWDAHFLAFTVVLFLLAAYHACRKAIWAWQDIMMLAGSLTLLTYGYFSGRVLGPLFAIGLLSFATSWHRLVAILKTLLAYGVTLIPIVLFNRSHPGMLTKRLYEISYIKPGAPWREIASEFVRRYLEDQSLYPLLMVGDYHPRHHVQGSGGAIFFATFILTMIGLLLVFVCGGWRDPWWRFVVYGLAVSIVPGAITNEPFHELRLTGYAAFLLLLTVPALECLLARCAQKKQEDHKQEHFDAFAADCSGIPRAARLALLALLLAGTLIQAIDFQAIYSRKGPDRVNEFDVPYKAAYDAAVSQPQRPIYLEDGMWGPAYMDAYWYATVERRPVSEFIRLPDRAKPPPGAIVLSSNSDCQNCQPVQKNGCYLLYRAK